MAQRPLIYIKPGFLPACPSENILLFWTMHRFCTGYNCVGWERFFKFFFFLSTETIKSISEEILKVNRHKHWQSSMFSCWCLNSRRRRIIPLKVQGKKHTFLHFCKVQSIDKTLRNVFSWCNTVTIDCQQCVDFRFPELYHICGYIFLLKCTQRDHIS